MTKNIRSRPNGLAYHVICAGMVKVERRSSVAKQIGQILFGKNVPKEKDIYSWS